jgi:hypothetical protein
MDFNNAEIDVVTETWQQPTQTVVDLSELQLALVGGGCGEVTPY